MGAPRRGQREKEEVREAILQAAMRLFLEEGFENVSIRKIARKVGYSPAAIYLYFKDKGEILYVLYSRALLKFYEEFQHLAGIEDPWKRLQMSGRCYLKFALSNPEYYDMMFILRGPFKEIERGEEMNRGLLIYEGLKQNVRACIDAGVFPESTDPEAGAFALWSFVHGVASLIIRNRLVNVPEEALEGMIEGAFGFMEWRMAGSESGNRPEIT